MKWSRTVRLGERGWGHGTIGDPRPTSTRRPATLQEVFCAPPDNPQAFATCLEEMPTRLAALPVWRPAPRPARRGAGRAGYACFPAGIWRAPTEPRAPVSGHFVVISQRPLAIPKNRSHANLRPDRHRLRARPGSGPPFRRQVRQARRPGREGARCVGGVCINTGTIPSKTMREAVLHLSGYYYQNIYGVNYRVKDKITHGGSGVPRPARDQDRNRRDAGAAFAQQHRMLSGIASFVDPHTIRVAERARRADYQAETIVIATGTKPAVSPKVPINGRNIINSDQILQMPEIPKTLIVVGGGVIGVEYTCMFATLGVRVILVEKRPRLLEFADAEIVEALSYHLRDHRVTMRLNEEVASVEETPDGVGGGQSGEQEKALGRRAALRGGPAGQCGRTEPGGRRHRSRRARAHPGGRRITAPSSRTSSRWAT